MTRQPLVARRAEQLLGTPVVSTAPVAGGDVTTATKLRFNDGSQALMKTLPHCPENFFPREAYGLRWLAETDGVAVPEVLAVEAECLVLRWVEPGRPSMDAAEDLGHALAVTHRAGAPGWGDDEDGFIGKLPLINRPAETWAEFYTSRRLLPYLKVAADRGAIEPADVESIESLVAKLPGLLPDEPPARLHGDLWAGNVIWGADGTAWLVDPAVYGGHREVDLAMLALFGLPYLERVQDAYHDEYPFADGWEERLGLHQLFPLLVHACLYGGGYGHRAADVARRYL